MITSTPLGRGCRYFPEHTALASNETRSTFVNYTLASGGIAAALTKHGFKAGDRLAILLPNEPDYIGSLCVRLAGYHSGSVNTRSQSRNRRHPRRRQAARPDSPFIAAGPNRASFLATGCSTKSR